jgi:tetratricopeptide (TPR) repeat protein
MAEHRDETRGLGRGGRLGQVDQTKSSRPVKMARLDCDRSHSNQVRLELPQRIENCSLSRTSGRYMITCRLRGQKGKFPMRWLAAVSVAVCFLVVLKLPVSAFEEHSNSHATPTSQKSVLSGSPTDLAIDEAQRRCLENDPAMFRPFAGDPKMVLRYCTQAIRSGKLSGLYLAWAFNNRGRAYYIKHDYDLAIQEYTQAIRVKPDFADAFNNRGAAYHTKGDYDRAIQDYSQAIHLNPGFGDALHKRGFAYYKKGDFERALQDYNEAIRLHPAFTATTLSNRGSLYSERGNYDQAIRDYSEAIDLRRGTVAADFAGRGKAYSAKHDYDRAVVDYEQAIRLAPDDSSLRIALAKALSEKHDLSLNAHPNDAEVNGKPNQAQKQSTPSRAGATSSNFPTVGQRYDPALLHPSTLQLRAPDTFYVEFMTTRGGFIMTVNRSWAPIGADRFYNLVKHHFYDDMPLYRVVPRFAVQFGISSHAPLSEAWRTATLRDDPATQSNWRGSVAFAASGPNTRATQLLINLKDNLELDSRGYAPFAMLSAEGMKVVDTFYDKYGNPSTQDELQFARQGKDYSERNWPKLDRIIKAAIIDIPQ